MLLQAKPALKSAHWKAAMQGIGPLPVAVFSEVKGTMRRLTWPLHERPWQPHCSSRTNLYVRSTLRGLAFVAVSLLGVLVDIIGKDDKVLCGWCRLLLEPVFTVRELVRARENVERLCCQEMREKAWVLFLLLINDYWVKF